MDQGKHLIDKDQAKYLTRSTARHLRRKRLHNARKNDQQQNNIANNLNVESNEGSIAVEESKDQPEVITKSKIQKLPKKNKVKQVENCNSNCEPYDQRSLVTTESVTVRKVIGSKRRRNRREFEQSNFSQSFRNLFYLPSMWPWLDDGQEAMRFMQVLLTVATFSELDENMRIQRATGAQATVFPSNEDVESSSLVTIENKMTEDKGVTPEKSREAIKDEREAKKALKALAKKSKIAKEEGTPITNKNTLPDSKWSKEDNRTSGDTNKTISLEGCTEGKSKAELRAERRAKQEAQRAAKEQLLQEKNKVKNEVVENDKIVKQIVGETVVAKKIMTPKKNVPKDDSHEINLFKHLYHEREQAIVNVQFVNSNIHPAIVRLGTQYASKVIVGSNARCVALLATVKELIQDFERPLQADFIRGLEASLQESVAYLRHCRPLAVSTQNALRHLKWQMTQLPPALSDSDAKNKLCNAIDTYILEQIQLAGKAISITIQTKISDGDVILTYGYSSLIHKILLDAHTAGKKFRVIVVDGRPWLEGKELLRRLVKNGLECSYILINAMSYVMPQVSKVFLGAHAILANGAVMSRVGTAQVALMAKAFNIPVLVACETHKSCERVQTDSIVYNELGNANELAQVYAGSAKKSLLANWKTKKSLNLLNITYDVTPADLVTAVVTELAILPCTSVPVILRIKPSEI